MRSLARRLKELRAQSGRQRETKLDSLLSPIDPWPVGMPSSADPYVVLLGVSPGNSPSAEHKGGKTNGAASSLGPTFGQPHPDFFYPDTKRYWHKARDLSRFLVRRAAPNLSEDDALALSSHLNLGTGQNGKAGDQAIEPRILKWVSHLLQFQWKPKIFVCFGSNNIFKKKRYRELWSADDGLPVPWTSTPKTAPFRGYEFRLWIIPRANGERMAVLMWPNHPSRHPFSGGADSKNWRLAKRVADGLLTRHGF